MGTQVLLTSDEMRQAAEVGVERRIQSMLKGLKHKHGYTGQNAWQTDIEASMAEMAAAIALEVEFPGTVNTFKVGGDLEETIQVRHSEREDGSLIVRPDDRDEDTFVLVVGTAPRYRVCGWMPGKIAKLGTPRSPNNREPAWFVAQEKLRDLELLKKKIH